jgi:putative serine protease PepD
MTSPRHLWSGRWQEESESARDEAPTEIAQPPGEAPTEVRESTPPTSPPETPSSGGGGAPRSLRPLAILATGLVLILGGAYAVTQLTDDSSNKTTAQTLPASTTAAPAPKDSSAQAVNAAAGPSVAAVRTSTGEGSGFLVRDNRTLVTNAHVVDGATSVTVRFGSNGSPLNGRVTGRDPSSDLAVIQLLDTPPKDAKPLRLADSDRLAVGQEVIAIGNPFGLAGSLTEGVISGVGRAISAPNGFSIENAIQTDAAINHGNSGGPLLDTAGRVVGVNSQIETGGTSGGNVGVGFAVPSNTLRRVVPVLADGKTYEHAWLGIAGPQQTTGGEAPATIQGITAGGPAGDAGLRVGDTITQVGGTPVAQFSDVVKAIDNAKPGDKVDVKVKRGGNETTVGVTLGTRPATPQP